MLAGQLREEPDPVDRHARDLSRQLPMGIVRSGGAAPVSGSREPAVPANLDRLDLATSRLLYLTPQGWANASDQVGQEPVVGVLCAWVRDWRETLFPREGLPSPTVAALAGWLGDRLDAACDRHHGVDEFATDLHGVYRALRRTLGLNAAPPEKCQGVQCRACDRMNTLYREGGLIQCKWCGLHYSEKGYQEWVALLNANARQRMRDGDLEITAPPPAKRRDPGEPRRSLVRFPAWVETRQG